MGTLRAFSLSIIFSSSITLSISSCAVEFKKICYQLLVTQVIPSIQHNIVQFKLNFSNIRIGTNFTII